MSWKTDVRQYCPKKNDRILATTVSIYCAFSVPGTVCLSYHIFELAFLIITNLSGSLLLTSFPQEKKFSYLFMVAQVIIGQDSNLGLSDFQTRALNPSVILPWKGCVQACVRAEIRLHGTMTWDCGKEKLRKWLFARENAQCSLGNVVVTSPCKIF